VHNLAAAPVVRNAMRRPSIITVRSHGQKPLDLVHSPGGGARRSMSPGGNDQHGHAVHAQHTGGSNSVHAQHTGGSNSPPSDDAAARATAEFAASSSSAADAAEAKKLNPLADWIGHLHALRELNSPCLAVSIFAARELKNLDLLNMSDPYCIVQLLSTPRNMPMGVQKHCKVLGSHRTPVVKNCLEPVWDVTFDDYKFEYSFFGNERLDLRIQVWDRDVIQDDFMGEVLLTLVRPSSYRCVFCFINVLLTLKQHA
jgi:hypothetical protein